MIKRFYSPSFSTSVVIGVIVFFTLFNIAHWRNLKVIQSDAVCYYSFLPAIFVFDDLSFSYIDDLPNDFQGLIWTERTPDGQRVQKTTMGLAVLYAPFFAAAHTLAEPLGYKADGYSVPYQMAISLSAGFFAFLGILFLRKSLLRYFTEKVASIVLVTLVLGTNLYYYATSEGSMSHIYSFFLIAAFLEFSLRFISKPTYKNILGVAVFGGFACLVRPANVLIFMIPLLYGITDIRTAIEKLQFIKKHLFKILFMALCIFVISVPQLFYWKFATGKWIYFSYVGERFYFNNPHIIEGLFGYRKGWLLYTPIMGFSLIGFFFLRKKLAGFALPLTLFSAVNIYIIFSWWCWWYGGSFSCRPLVDTYAIFAFPLGAFFTYVLKQKAPWRVAFFTIVIALMGLNLFQTQQKRENIIHFDGMTKEVYWKVFGKLHHPPDFWSILDSPDYNKAKQGLPESTRP